MKEIRIYYECLEQANDYILPIIQQVVMGKANFRLIKRPRNPKQLKGSMAAIQSLATPDILLTGIDKNFEYPLALLEFTEAVTTEDHELQRTYGAVASYLTNMFYIKISGHKQSEKVFGGAEYNPYSTPKILLEKLNYEGFIIADWKTEGNEYTLKRSNNLPSCPPEIPILTDSLQAIVKGFIENTKNWYSKSLNELKQEQSYKAYYKEVESAASSEDLLKTWEERECRNKNLNKLRYFVRKDWVGAKINRFSHAMDPDRGILTFISFIFSKTHSIYGIYALVRPRSTDELKDEMKSLKSLKLKLNSALEKDSGGIPQWFANELKNIVKQAKSINEEINIQSVWEKYKSQIADNKVVMTIAYFLDGLYLNHNGIKLVWDRYKLLENVKSDFLELLKKRFDFTKYAVPTPTEIIKDDVDEDEVTYIIAHRLLIPNKFRIVSISYPGSQGGGAILPEPEKGKAQPREYPDIIALTPENHKTTDVILNESKGMFNQQEVEKDSKKILRYKSDEKLQKALNETLVVAKVIDKNDKIHNILIGVAFGVTSNTTTTWKPDKVDFIFRIVDRKKWAIGIFNQNLRNLIKKIEGRTNFPVVYKILSNSEGFSTENNQIYNELPLF